MTAAAVRGFLGDYLSGSSALLVASSNEQASELASMVRSELVGLGLVADSGAPAWRRHHGGRRGSRAGETQQPSAAGCCGTADNEPGDIRGHGRSGKTAGCVCGVAATAGWCAVLGYYHREPAARAGSRQLLVVTRQEHFRPCELGSFDDLAQLRCRNHRRLIHDDKRATRQPHSQPISATVIEQPLGL